MTDTQTPRRFANLSELEQAVGLTLGPSEPITVRQARIDQFAAATEDHQWIHVDRERAQRGPFGGTIAHGYLTLSLVPHFLEELLHIDSAAMGVNYGLNRVRFPAPVPSGSTLTASLTIAAVTPGPAGTQVTLDVAIESSEQTRPVCVAQVIVLYAA